MNELRDHQIIIASDVGGERDGIGIEVYHNSELIIEVFRDDTKHTREVTLYKKDVSLSLIEETIAKFKADVEWDFQP